MDDDRRSVLRAIGIGALVFLVVMAFGAPRFFGEEGVSSPLVGQPAPDFSAPIVAGEGADAHDRVSLSALRGQVVLLDFWASWCGPCRVSIPIVGRVAARYASRGLVTYAVNVESDQPPARIAAAHRALDVPVPTLFDTGFEIQGTYAVSSLPTLVLVDRTGVVRRVHVGVPDEGWLDRVIGELL